MKFKKWVEILLQFVTIIAVFFLAAECDNFKLFVISKLICLAIILINITLLKNMEDWRMNKNENIQSSNNRDITKNRLR